MSDRQCTLVSHRNYRKATKLRILFRGLYQLPLFVHSQVFALSKARLYGSLWQHFHIATPSKILRQYDDINFVYFLNRISVVTTRSKNIPLNQEDGFPVERYKVAQVSHRSIPLTLS